jgi:hypothetical protein
VVEHPPPAPLEQLRGRETQRKSHLLDARPVPVHGWRELQHIQPSASQLSEHTLEEQPCESNSIAALPARDDGE